MTANFPEATIIPDLRFALRQLRKNPGFAAVAVLTLGLGVGANTAIFSVINAVLLRSPPFRAPEQLVFISEKSKDMDNMSVAFPNFRDWERQQDVFTDVAAFRTENWNLTGDGFPERIETYEPVAQNSGDSMVLVIKTTTAPMAVAQPVRNAILSLDHDQPVANVLTMDDLVARSVAERRLAVLLLGLFAGLALGLAAVGLYGVMAFNVAHRTREIGVRMALGAQAADVLKLILRQGGALVGLGIVLGLVGAFAVTRLMTRLLFQVQATDAVTYLLTSLVLLAVAFVACIIPALHAARVDPLVALRTE